MQIYNFSPGGNDTVLIDNQDKAINPEDYHTISQDYLVDSFEQVGFIVKGKERKLRLEMMGGEFCVNALRSLGAWICAQTGERNIKERKGDRFILIVLFLVFFFILFTFEASLFKNRDKA